MIKGRRANASLVSRDLQAISARLSTTCDITHLIHVHPNI